VLAMRFSALSDAMRIGLREGSVNRRANFQNTVMRLSADATTPPRKYWKGTLVVLESPENLTFQRCRRPGRSRALTPHIGVMQHLELSDQEAAALIKEIADIIGNDRYPFSPRIQTLRAILAKLRPEPAREPLPPTKVFAAASKRAARQAAHRERSGALP
jgi:hypothetical protein